EGGTQTKISIEQALSEIGIEVNPALTDFYSKNTAKRSMSSVMFGARYESLEDAVIGEVPVSSFVSAGIASGSGENAKLNNETIGDFSDAAIVVVSRRSSEAAEFNIGSATTEDGDSYDSPLDLTTYEKEVIKMAANSFDKVIVLINSDQALGIDAIKNDNDIDAILWAGLPGAEGFRGVASIIAGNANPSGHLPDTFAVHPASAPANSNFGMFTWSNASVNGGSSLTNPDNGKGDWYVVENENIYVGYKYYETRYADALSGDAEALDASNTTEYVKSYSDYDESIPWDYNTQVSYSFGYGLSYTEFDETLESVTIDGESGVGLASVTVTNTGDVDGKAVVQLYVQAPYTMGGVEKVAIQLVDFTKVDVAAGESVNATIEFELSNFASYDTDKEQWVLEDGDYYFAIGNGAHEALNSVLLLQGNTDITVSTKEEKADAAMAKMISLGNVKSYMEVINENVENRFEQADYTNYDSSFNYITRSDWSKGWETIGTEDGKGQGAVAYTEEMEKGLYAQLYEITANDKTDDMNFAWDSGSGLKATQFIGVGIDETVNIDGTEYSYDDLVNTMSLQEACFFLENEYQNLDAIASIELGECVTNDGPAGFAYDQVPGYSYNWKEYESADPNYVASGDVNAQTSMAVYNTEPVVAATFNKELVYEEGKMFGEDSLWANENLVIAPGANLHRSAYNARNHEYYSEDSVLTNLLGVAFCEGAYTKGLMTQPKHYAFNHQEVNRIGTATFFNEQGGRELELRGFQGMMEKNVAQSVMTAFNRIGSEYAGANVGAMQGVARDEWGFEGFVVTDMVNGAMYMNWRDAFALGLSGTLGTNAYATTTLGASTSELNLKLIGDDAYLQQQIHDAVKYVLAAEMNSNFMNGMDATTRIVNVTPWWKIAFIAATVITGILTVLAIVFYAGALGGGKDK
ncbi:MAG: glycoside hydrolase family 3 protein, partial [Lachnospiraceae bacterium]|nr:glycoside hydrolase family 3 protein [Lachnospiraceae bacterium]